jgi:acetyltransferase-like isoleucine patch superfamily enzyme
MPFIIYRLPGKSSIINSGEVLISLPERWHGLRRDHRPYYIKKAYLKFQELYVHHFLRPQLEALGKGSTFIKPWHVEIFGSPIELGDYVNVVASADKRVRLAVWSENRGMGHIRLGDFSLICPGVRIGSAHEVIIGNNCMIASGAYVTDSDWHDIYNRISIGKTAPINIENNVWIGDSAIICKGVTVAENSIIGAGAVVVNSVPPNCIAAGNPAKVVKQLDAEEKFTTRQQWFADPEKLFKGFDQTDKQLLGENSMLHWLRYLLFPTGRD